LAAILVGGEVGLLTQTVRAFAFLSQQEGRQEDIRRAKAGYEVALIGQMSDLYEDARALKRFAKMYDLLMRSEFRPQLLALATAGSPLLEIEPRHQRLRRAAGVCCALLVMVHLTAPVFLLNNIAGRSLIPADIDMIAAWVFGGFVILAALSVFLVWRMDLRFEGLLQAGKERDA
jgi:hypothetical protein